MTKKDKQKSILLLAIANSGRCGLHTAGSPKMRVKLFQILLLFLAAFVGAVLTVSVQAIQWSSIQEVQIDRYPLVAPPSRIALNQIWEQGGRLLIDLPNFKVFSIAPLGTSMLPTLGAGTKVIGIPVKNIESLAVGDIVIYQDVLGSMLGHRIIETGVDTEGWYAIAKGDNNPQKDPGKLRIGDIKHRIVAILY